MNVKRKILNYQIEINCFIKKNNRPQMNVKRKILNYQIEITI